jgi:hypothetical protein
MKQVLKADEAVVREPLRMATVNLGLVAGSLILLGVLLEIGVRLVSPQPVTRYRFSPDTFYEPIPGARQ